MRQRKSPESFLSMFIVRNKIIIRNILQVKLYCVSPPYNWSGPLLFKGEVSWGFLVSFVKNDEIRPLISCQIILE